MLPAGLYGGAQRGHDEAQPGDTRDDREGGAQRIVSQAQRLVHGSGEHGEQQRSDETDLRTQQAQLVLERRAAVHGETVRELIVERCPAVLRIPDHVRREHEQRDRERHVRTRRRECRAQRRDERRARRPRSAASRSAVYLVESAQPSASPSIAHASNRARGALSPRSATTSPASASDQKRRSGASGVASASPICASGMHAMIAAARSIARSPPSTPDSRTSTADASAPASTLPMRTPSGVAPSTSVPARTKSAIADG